MSDAGLDDCAPVPVERVHTIRLLPVNLFASIMGLAGLSLAWRDAAKLGIVAGLPGEFIGWTAIGMFIALSFSYGVKIARHPHAIVAEYDHPVMNNFFATITISVLLLSAFLQPYSAIIAQGVWVTGGTDFRRRLRRDATLPGQTT
ncbi:hypothetical protein [Rhizobium tumorigenes]|uniref:SLAC1 family transporter n=1 Tax=Rhizobium tumorigenes TaxID=2041385 RepID=UPI00241EBBA9|nr:hypothetical protein [Rhizobium tumorigenes]WFS03611.1 hypothetical protein PR016_20320 [Rhizobium tumorigenes]